MLLPKEVKGKKKTETAELVANFLTVSRPVTFQIGLEFGSLQYYNIQLISI